jgi:hypothetical protein
MAIQQSLYDAREQAKQALDAATATYNQELSDYNNFRSNWITAGNTPGGIVNGHDNQYWASMMNGSAASLTVKKAQMYSAQNTLNAAQKAIDDALAADARQQELDFQKNNPQVFQQIEQAKIQQQADVQKNKDALAIQQQLAAQDQSFAQKRSNTIMWFAIGGGFLVLITGLYFFFKKEKPAPNA